MEPINHKQHAATWLEIALTYSRQATTLELLITFINKSECSKSFLKDYIYIYEVSIYNFLKSLLSFC